MAEKAATELFAGAEELTGAFIAELFHNMREQLEPFEEAGALSVAQQEHVRAARCSLEAVVAEWIDDVTARRAGQSNEKEAESKDEPVVGTPAERLDPLLEMLQVYYEDASPEQYTSRQQQRIMVAMHNLVIVVKEIEAEIQ